MRLSAFFSALFIIIFATGMIAVSNAAPDPRYHDYDEVLAFFDTWASQYPSIFHREVIGYTLVGNEPIWAARISDNASVSEPEARVLYHAAVHSNEANGTNTIIYMMDRLLSRYGQQDYYTEMVDNLELWFVPTVNIDGSRIVFSDNPDWDWWRKTKRDNNDDGQYTFPMDGVDPNRNWDYRWAEYDSTAWESSRYKGPYPFSEPEVVAIRDLILRERPVILADLHSPDVPEIGRKIWWPWLDPESGQYGPDRYIYLPICETLGNRTETEVDGTYYDGDGPAYNTLPKEQCWVYANTGICALLMEISRQFWWTGAAVDTIAARAGRGLFYLPERALSGPGLTGIVTDSFTGAPVEAEIVVQQVHNPSIGPRLTEAAHGQYHRLLNSGSYTVTASADGYTSDTQSVSVTSANWATLDFALDPTEPPQGPWIVFNAATVDDDQQGESLGNGDGDCDAGERIELIVLVDNVGTDIATNVRATLSTESPYCSIVDDAEDFGDIPADNQAACIEDYDLIIDPECPDGYSIAFSLFIESDNRASWESSFQLLVDAPIMSLVSFNLDDTVGGNSNGHAEPGETITLETAIGNAGNGDATNLTLSLITTHPLVTITQNEASLALLPAGSQGITSAPPFEVVIDPTCPDPDALVATLLIDADWDQTAALQFMLPIGGFFDEMEDGLGTWSSYSVTDGFVDQWHRSEQRNYTPGGNWSWKFGDSGGGDYESLSDGALEFEPVTLRENSFLRFHYWMDAEVSGSYPGSCYDGGMVEMSIDGGAWSQIFPVGGYTHQIRGTSGPWPEDTPVYSGTTDWAEATFEITDLSGEASFRFRFGSDSGVEREGWYIDSVEFFGYEEFSDTESLEPLVLNPSIDQNQPNPFGPFTVIGYQIPMAGEARLQIFDPTGRLVRTLVNGHTGPGAHWTTWDGRDDAGNIMGSGVYLYRLQAEGASQTRRMILMR